jgi:P pilus assembly chaperone PapD
MKRVFALAALTAFGFSGVAYAAEATRAPTTMTDAEMDKVTAGVAYVNVYNPGEVYVTIYTNGQGPNPPDGLTVYPGSTSSRVCVNSCSF